MKKPYPCLSGFTSSMNHRRANTVCSRLGELPLYELEILCLPLPRRFCFFRCRLFVYLSVCQQKLLIFMELGVLWAKEEPITLWSGFESRSGAGALALEEPFELIMLYFP